MSKKKNKLIFENGMYNNPYGSLVVRWFWYYGDQFTTSELKKLIKIANKKWKVISMNPNSFIDFLPSDKDFFKKDVELFELPDLGDDYLKQTARLTSNFNQIYIPYIDGKKYPIREDGFVGVTYKTGKLEVLGE